MHVRKQMVKCFIVLMFYKNNILKIREINVERLLKEVQYHVAFHTEQLILSTGNR